MDKNTKHVVASNLAAAQASAWAMVESQKTHANVSYFTEDAIFRLYERYVSRLEVSEKEAKKAAKKA